MEDGYRLVESCSISQLLGNLSSPASSFRFFFPDLDLFRFFIWEADILIEIFLDELKIFPAALEEDVVKSRDLRDRAHRL